ncbi:MAG: UDP-N-acetylglucosamine 1-carboxyvinyltransferase [Chloroflexi bacterium]|nr:UDP-N-acetylglucosamine 1-carboxyvinyltransferase [Chloroflexota bacterium]
MERFVIEGGYPLNGTVRPSGIKNAALPILAASLLTEEPLVLENVPKIRDVETMCQLLQQLGVEVERTAQGELILCARRVTSAELDPELTRHIRGSVLLAGPLLARMGRVQLPLPGGDVIGRRRLDTHLLSLTALGAKITEESGYRMRADRLRGQDILLDEASVTATENALMAASRAEGTTVLRNAASEPHVQELARVLQQMGARIEGIGSNTLTVHGATALHGARWSLAPDHIEVGSFIGLGAVTPGELVIKDAAPENLRMTNLVMRRLGVRLEVRGNDVVVPDGQDLEIIDDAQNTVPKIDDGPWPAFPADTMSIALVVATQSRGTALIHEKMFESRLYFVDKLIAMGARIILCDPHRAIVVGPAQLHGEQLESPDIRAGMALLIASLCARGQSVIRNIVQIDRGYEQVEVKLQALGAHIQRLS